MVILKVTSVGCLGHPAPINQRRAAPNQKRRAHMPRSKIQPARVKTKTIPVERASAQGAAGAARTITTL